MSGHESFPNKQGWATSGNEGIMEAERTAENDHFFLSDNRLVYHGSALIVSLLEMHQVIQRIVAETDEKPPVRNLAFFDKRGRYYGPVVLNRLVHNVDDIGTSSMKHTAIFEPTGAEDEAFAIQIDNIYCLSLAKPDGSQPAPLEISIEDI